VHGPVQPPLRKRVQRSLSSSRKTMEIELATFDGYPTAEGFCVRGWVGSTGRRWWELPEANLAWVLRKRWRPISLEASILVLAFPMFFLTAMIDQRRKLTALWSILRFLNSWWGKKARLVQPKRCPLQLIFIGVRPSPWPPPKSDTFLLRFNPFR
jgi:hypothetical protein